MKRVVVLGSTGSIGTQTLDVIAQHPDELQVVGLAARSNERLLSEQSRRFGVKHCALFDGPSGGTFPNGMDALVDLATLAEADVVVVSVAGVIGLLPTLAAIKAGKAIALASKEVLVAAGELVMNEVRKAKTLLTPIDSEHSAIFQCLNGSRPDQVERLILTASGGPFRGRTHEQLRAVTVEEALNHPTWKMGGKITVDSATLMNKGLETIEASWLFGVPIEKVDVVVHPQSIVHSFVQFTDGSVLGQMGWPDMRLPIAYSLLYPERLAGTTKAWNPVETPTLTFEPVDEAAFPSLRLARESVQNGGTMPCAFNASNEEAANAFLKGEIGFVEIFEIVERTMSQHRAQVPTLESILETDAQSRAFSRMLIGAARA